MDPLAQHRARRFLGLGFTPGHAEALALTKVQEPDAHGRLWTRFLYWGKAKALLDRGATHDQVFRIFSEESCPCPYCGRADG